MGWFSRLGAGELPAIEPPKRRRGRGHVVLLLASGNPTFSGGVPGQVLSRAKYLADRDFEITIIARGNPSWNGLQEVEGIRVFALKPRDFKLGKWIEKQWFHPLLGCAIEEFLAKLNRSIPIDHLLIFDSQAGVPAIKFGKKHQITTQFTLHGSALLPYTLPPLLRALSPKWEAYCYKSATLIAPIGEAIAAHFASNFQTSRPIKLLRNALNPTFFSPSGERDSDGYFLFAGRLEPDKRPLAMIKAIETGKLDPGIKIKIVGDGSMRTEISEIAARHPQIEFPQVGAKNATEMREAYNSARCLVWTSIAEAMAVAPLESMAMGVPVIVPNIPSAIELVGKDYPAIVEIDDAEGLAKTMNRVHRDEDYRHSLTQIGDEVCKPYHPNVAYRELEIVLDEQILTTRKNRIELK